MSLRLGAALKRGATQLVSRTGVVILAAYAAVLLLYQLSVNTLLQSLLTSLVPAGSSAQTPDLVTLPLPTVVAGGLVVLTLLAATIVSVVAIRTFVADERDHIPRRFLTERMAFAVANVVVGGIAFALVVLVGTLFFVVPGIVAYVGLLFMVQFVAVENDNFLTAMRRSWRLTKGNRLRVFLLVVVLFAVVFAVTFAVSFGLGTVLAPGSGGVAGLAVTVVNVVATLYLLAVVSDAFVQLRERDGPRRGIRPTTDALGA